MGILSDTVKSRVDIQTTNSHIENPKARYDLLVEEIKAKTNLEIKTQIEVIKAMYEIREKKLFQHGGYKSFNAFVRDYKLGRSQVYRYLIIAEGLQKNILTEKEVEEKGLKESERVFKKVSTGGHLLKKPLIKDKNKDSEGQKAKIFSIDAIPVKYQNTYNKHKKFIRERLKDALDTAEETLAAAISGLTSRLEGLKKNTIMLMADEKKNVWINDVFDVFIKHTTEVQKRGIVKELSKTYKDIMDGRRYWNKQKKKPRNKRI